MRIAIRGIVAYLKVLGLIRKRRITVEHVLDACGQRPVLESGIGEAGVPDVVVSDGSQLGASAGCRRLVVPARLEVLGDGHRPRPVVPVEHEVVVPIGNDPGVPAHRGIVIDLVEVTSVELLAPILDVVGSGEVQLELTPVLSRRQELQREVDGAGLLLAKVGEELVDLDDRPWKCRIARNRPARGGSGSTSGR